MGKRVDKILVAGMRDVDVIQCDGPGREEVAGTLDNPWMNPPQGWVLVSRAEIGSEVSYFCPDCWRLATLPGGTALG